MPWIHRAGPLRPDLELTVHGFLLEEGRHGQGPRPRGPARPGPAGDSERTGRKGRPLESSEWRSLWAREEGGVSTQDPQRAVSAKPTAAESPGAQVTAN